MANIIQSCVPVPRSYNGPDMIEAMKKTIGLHGWVCLPNRVEWAYIDGRATHPTKAFAEWQWRKAILDETKGSVFLQIDVYPFRTGPLADCLPPALKNKPSFGDRRLQESLLQEVLVLMAMYRPKYFCVGMEIGDYYEHNPDDFPNFVSLFAKVRAAIKKVSPSTKVFPSFQYEVLIGEQNPPQWDLLKMFEMDCVAVTTYPELLSGGNPFSPFSLPQDYYTEITRHTNLPIVFAEMGWSNPNPKIHMAREYLKQLHGLLLGMNVELVNWWMLHDFYVFGEFFKDMGLFDKEGNPKSAVEVWAEVWPRPTVKP